MIEKIKTEICNIVGENLQKIILFGSRARGDFRGDSDYDILIVLNNEISESSRKDLFKTIVKRLAKCFIDVDVIIKSESEYRKASNQKGSISRIASLEGSVL